MNEQTELPPGYSLKHNDCCKLIFVRKNDMTIRRDNSQPVTFAWNEQDQAIKFAWWHHDEQQKTANRRID